MEPANRREKLFLVLALGVYMSGWFMLDSKPAIGALAFVFAVPLAAASVPSNVPNRIRYFFQTIGIAAVLVIPALGLAWFKYHAQEEASRFRNYLQEHNCQSAGEVVTGYSEGGCDRYGNCTDGHEIEEREFLCTSTGRRITFSQFKNGEYGR